MDTSARVWIALVAVGGALLVVPVIAWRAWSRRPRPRPVPLLVVALATTAPLATALVGVAGTALLVRSFERNAEGEPSEKARLLAETISEVMNGTVFVVIGAAALSGVIVAVSRWRGRHRSQ